jgi:cytoskeleton protein RodZ
VIGAIRAQQRDRGRYAVLQDRKANLLERRGFLSSYDSEELRPHLAARVGADLRDARERLGWTLPAVAAHLRIRLPYLQALEEGRSNDLPGAAYAIGFLRTYAQALGLDPDEMARRFRAEAAEPNRKPELNLPVPVPSRGVPAGAVVLVGCVIAIGGYIAWYRISEHARPAVESVQPVPDRLASIATPQAPAAIAPAATTGSGSPAAPAASGVSMGGAAWPEAPSGDTTVATPPTPITVPAAAASTTQAAAASPPPSATTSPTEAAAAPPAPPTADSAIAASTPPGAAKPGPVQPMTASTAAPAGTPDATASGQIVLRATGDAWVQVRERSGHVLFNRVMRAGDTWTVPDNPTCC